MLYGVDFFSCSRKGPRENVWYHTMERASVPYPRLGMEQALFHTYGTSLVPYLWNGPLYHTLGWGMRWKSDSEVWNGYGTGMVRSCKISPLVFLTRATPGTWSVPYLWNGPLYHTQGRVWNGPCSIPMERTLFHTLVRMNPAGLHHTFKKIAAISQNTLSFCWVQGLQG